MKVSDAIEALSQMDPDLEVVTAGSDHTYLRIFGIWEMSAETDGNYLGECEPSEPRVDLGLEEIRVCLIDNR